MSSLQCPARLLVARPGEAPALAAAVRGERVVRVCCGPLPASVETAEAVGAVLGVGVVVREDLRGLRVAGLLPGVLAEIADEHRGEAVLVVGEDLTLAGAGPVQLEVDDDGWRVVGPEAASG